MLAGVATDDSRPLLVVTGASGFVGRHVVTRALGDGQERVRVITRGQSNSFSANVERIVLNELGPDVNWRAGFEGAKSVVHCAARVHVRKDRAANPLDEFRRINVAGSAAIFRQAAQSGVKRFVFVSSVKVNGERTDPGHPAAVEDPARPVDPYGISKYEAEQQLGELAASTGVQLVVVRPVLVYGPGVKGNLLLLMKLLNRHVPLPFGSVANRRSLIDVHNLAQLLLTCARHPNASGKTFLASDGDDLSTPQLIRALAKGLGVSAHLVGIPVSVLRTLANAAGVAEMARRLLDSLVVDSTPARQLLGWSPERSAEEGLAKTAAAFAHS